jgi:quercetin dioxygenase-like cupin family protein
MKQTLASRRGALVLVATLIVGAVVGIGADRALFAQSTQPGGIKRTILLRADEPGSTTHEAVMGIAEIPANTNAGRHRHNGIEIGYVLEGSITLEHEGQPTRTLKAGEAFKNDPGVHDAKNTSGKPVKILAVYLVEKGKPLAEPVP